MNHEEILLTPTLLWSHQSCLTETEEAASHRASIKSSLKLSPHVRTWEIHPHSIFIRLPADRKSLGRESKISRPFQTALHLTENVKPVTDDNNLTAWAKRNRCPFTQALTGLFQMGARFYFRGPDFICLSARCLPSNELNHAQICTLQHNSIVGWTLLRCSSR